MGTAVDLAYSPDPAIQRDALDPRLDAGCRSRGRRGVDDEGKPALPQLAHRTHQRLQH